MIRQFWKRLLAVIVMITLIISNPGLTVLADEIQADNISVPDKTIQDTFNELKTSKSTEGFEIGTEDLSIKEADMVEDSDLTIDGLPAVEVNSVDEPEYVGASNGQILIGEETTASVTADVPEAKFQFTAETTGRYVFYSLNNEDTYGNIYDTDDNVLYSDDDSGENGDFRIVFDAEAGSSYILGVRFYDVNVAGSIRFIVEKEPALLSISAIAQNTVLENTHGYYEYGNDEWFYYYLDSFNPIYTVVTEAGEYSGTKDQIFDQLGYSIELSSNQSENSPWRIGKNTVTATVGTISGEFEIEIIESEEFEQSKEINGLTICVSAPKGAFPVNALLEAEILSDTVKQQMADLAKNNFYYDEERFQAVAYAFLIKVTDGNGETLQPEEDNSVRITVSLDEASDDNLTPYMYCFGDIANDYGTECTVDKTDGLVSVDATLTQPNFLLQFSYEKLSYSMQGGTSVPIDSIVEDVGLTGEVTNVICSNTDLFSASLEGDSWVLHSSESFNFEEWIQITINNLDYKIFITDESIIASGVMENGLRWILDSEGLLSISGNCCMSELNEYPWKEYSDAIQTIVINNGIKDISNDAFSGCNNLSEVAIPATVVSIGDYAFASCGALQSVNLSEGLKTISSGAFQDDVSLSEITLPGSVTVLGSDILSGTSISSITIPNKITEAYGALAGALYLDSIVFEDGIKKIPGFLFEGSSYVYVNEIIIPDSVKEIGERAFAECPLLQSIELPNELEIIGNGSFQQCSGLVEITLPASIKTISGYAFSDCSNLVTVTMTDNDKYIRTPQGFKLYSLDIEESAFSGCTKLLTVRLSKNVISISSEVFRGCRSLANLILPANLKTLGMGSFGGTKIASIIIPASLTNIEENAFYGASYLENVSFEEGIQIIPDYCLSSSNGISFIKTVTLPESVTKIGYSAFCSNEYLEEINIPANVEIIADNAFENCPKLTTVSFSENDSYIQTPDGNVPFTLKIGSYAFSECRSLANMQLPQSVSEIGAYAFSNTALSNITLGKNMKSIGECFISGTSIRNVTIPASLMDADGAFENTTMLNEVIFEEGITNVPSGICRNDSGKNRIDSVVLPEGVKRIESRAFARSTRLTSVSIPRSVSFIDYDTFEECSPIIYVYKSSYAELWAIENGFKYLYLNSEEAEDDEKVLDVSGTSYYTNTDVTSINSSIPLYLRYKVKKSDRPLINNMVLSITLSPALDPVDGTFTLNNSLLDDYEYDESTNKITIPLEDYEGSAQLYVRPTSLGQIASYATLSYNLGYESLTEVIGTISLEVPVLTMQVPTKISTTSFKVSGLTEPKTSINLYIDEQQVSSITSKKDGSYSTILSLLETPVNGKSYQVKAVLDKDSEIYSSSRVMYLENTPELNEFCLYFDNSSDSAIDLLDSQNARTTITYVPGTQMTFKLRFNNPDQLERVFVESRKGIEEKKIEAFPSGKPGEYITSGYFDNNDPDYLPGAIYVTYRTASENYEVIASTDNDEETVSESWQNPQYDRRVNDDINHNYEGSVTNNDGDTVDYEYHTGTPQEIATELMGDTTGYNSSSATGVIEEFSTRIGSGSDYSVIAKSDSALIYEKQDGTEYGYVFTESNGRKLVSEIIKGPVDKGLGSIFKNSIGIKPDHASGIASGISGLANAIYAGHNTYVDINRARASIASDASMSAAQKNDAYAALNKMEKSNRALSAFRLVTTGIKAGLIFTGHPVLAAGVGVIGNMVDSIWQGRINDGIKYAKEGKQYYLKWLVDPSGYVYEAVTDNYIENAVVTAWFKEDENSEPVIWDAEEDGQSNPLYTDSRGFYAWDTPEGLWQVVVEKPGYETWRSEWLTVPPVQTDVNAALISQANPFVDWYQVDEHQIEIQFSQFMDPESIYGIEVRNSSGEVLSYTLEYDTTRTDEDGKIYADYYNLQLNNGSLAEGERCSLVIPNSVINYAGKAVSAEVIRAVRSVNRVLAVQSEADIIYTRNVEIPITVTNAGDDTVVMAESSSPMIARVVSVEPTGNGVWIATVYGALPGTADIIVSMSNSAVCKVVTCMVSNDGQAQDAIDVDSITISTSKQEIYTGEKLQFTANVLPDDADDKTVIWATDKNSIATIDSNGLLTAVHAGTVQVVARALRGNAVAVYTVSVLESQQADEIQIVSQPTNFNGKVGDRASFEVDAVGAELSYQWQVLKNGSSWINSGLSSAKKPTLTFTASNAYNGMKFRCVISDSFGNQAITDEVSVTLFLGPEILEQPVSCEQAKGKRVSFNVVATGENLSYQWQYLRVGSTNWANSGLSSAKSSILSFTMSSGYDGLKFRCIITDVAGNTTTSDEVSATMIVGPVITEQPESCEQVKGKKVRFTIEAEGDGLSYQWQYLRAGNTNWTNSGLSSAKSNTLTFNMSAGYDGMLFRCVVTDKDGLSVISDSVLATLNVGPVIVTQTSSIEQALGTPVNLSVEVNGEDLSYKWQFLRKDTTTWKNSSAQGATTNSISFKMAAAHEGMQFRCIITDGNGNSVTSGSILLSVLPGPGIIEQPVSVEAALGVPVKIRVSASGTGITYQWQYQRKGKTTWSKSGLASGTSSTLSFTMAAGYDGMKFRCVVTDEDGYSIISDEALISMLEGPGIVTQPSDVNASSGTAVKINILAVGNDIIYEWQYQRATSSTWSKSNLSSAMLSTLSFKMSSAYDGMKFRCKVTDADGKEAYSDTVLISMVPGPAITKQPDDAAIALGSKASFSVIVSGEGLTYQWQFQKVGKTTWYNSSSSGNKTNKLSVSGTTGTNGMKFRCIVTDGDGQVAISNSAVLTVK